MRSFPKLYAGLAFSLAAVALLAASALAQKDAGEKPKAKDKKEKTADKEKEKADKEKKDDKAKGSGKIDIPVSKDHDAKGLKIPYFDGDGKKQMIYTIGVASRIDDDHIGMEDTQIETFDEDGEHEMTIDMPKSVLEVSTGVISTKKHVEINREDFSITGETMEFNTKTKQGTLGGHVRMLIYNIEAELPKKAEPSDPKAP